ncbi:MAG: outer membrane lipoprotein-sorting protein [Myxococcales bacterium]|nr:MAG: outer membrane lipoprotein-sorting protein [Myxococcales bacterium]
MGKRAWLSLFLMLVASTALAQKAELTADQIIDKSYDHSVMNFAAATSDMTMELIKGAEIQETRKVRAKALRVEEGKEELRRVLMTFVKPDDVAGAAFLSLENPGDADDDQFLYLPALKKVLRKGGKTGKNESFMGTQFTYGDMESKDVTKARHTRLADEKLGAVDCYVIESIPNNPKDETYSKYVTWVNKQNFVPMRIKLFDLKGGLQKVMMAEKIEPIDGKPTITQISMLNVQTQKATRLYLSNIDTKVALTPADFTKERMTKL